MSVGNQGNIALLFVPGLLCTERLFRPQIDALTGSARVSIGDHRHDSDISAIAERILRSAPERFALAGLSMGGYIALEIMRQAPQRVLRLALLDTSARPDTAQQTARRKELIAMAQDGRFNEVIGALIPNFIHPARHNDRELVAILEGMALETGVEAFVRQQNAIMTRADSRPDLGAISCPADIIVGAEDALTPPDLAREIASAIPNARLHEIADCGHIATLERAEQVNAILQDWLVRS